MASHAPILYLHLVRGTVSQPGAQRLYVLARFHHCLSNRLPGIIDNKTGRRARQWRVSYQIEEEIKTAGSYVADLTNLSVTPCQALLLQ